MREYRYHREAWHGRLAAALDNMSTSPPLWQWMATGTSGWGMDGNPPGRVTVRWASKVRNGIQLDSQGQDVGGGNELELEACQRERSLNDFGDRRSRSVRANIKTRRTNASITSPCLPFLHHLASPVHGIASSHCWWALALRFPAPAFHRHTHTVPQPL
ncbi:hypothetical protein FA13DRAFT_107853 [Coprinellus micaceus]|uniref:Uncharacterized protein n=1 Tax=Coprinellus micaceus TaxID=71717 RepID=A0A4Y7TJP0_COPMI|nr:hypothetical protein FA13DRAFT_107853 [Coprinellus micaceus]